MGLFCQFSHFIGNYSKTPPMLTRTGSFYSSI
jgi:hypothetical protein